MTSPGEETRAYWEGTAFYNAFTPAGKDEWRPLPPNVADADKCLPHRVIPRRSLRLRQVFASPTATFHPACRFLWVTFDLPTGARFMHLAEQHFAPFRGVQHRGTGLHIGNFVRILGRRDSSKGITKRRDVRRRLRRPILHAVKHDCSLNPYSVTRDCGAWDWCLRVFGPAGELE